jgi:hypothetical protein
MEALRIIRREKAFTSVRSSHYERCEGSGVVCSDVEDCGGIPAPDDRLTEADISHTQVAS